ncbi:MAG: chromate transporter [Clostridia bacterium]|nr:chromate transporter [Clostridia bacterium]
MKNNTNKSPTKSGKLLKLFFSTLYISAFTFGGGFVIIGLMKKKFADELHWIDEEEMMDITAIAQSSPGAIAVNAAILVGRKTAGIPGIAIAVTGTIIPPLIILSVVSFFYSAFAGNRYVALFLKGMQAGVAAMILDVVCSLGLKVTAERDLLNIFLMILSFAAAYFLKINVVLIILGAAVFGIVRYLVKEKKNGLS